MKRQMWLLIIGVLLVMTANSWAATDQNRDEFGLGFIVGEPSGVNAQFYWGPKASVAVTAAWSLNDWFFLAGDYQIVNRLADSPPEWRWFYGIGAYMGAPEKERGLFGGRIPLGIKYRIPNSIVDIWGEVVPALQLVPDTEGRIQGGVGVTFWIK
jgi:hypothetical protein